jgi:hypothetical protein
VCGEDEGDEEGRIGVFVLGSRGSEVGIDGAVFIEMNRCERGRRPGVWIGELGGRVAERRILKEGTGVRGPRDRLVS